MKKELQSILKISLLFYKKMRSKLESTGFEINLYDPCVANKKIKSTQITITWHVDDLQVSHKDCFNITKLIMWLEGIYSEILTVHKDKVYDYLVMDLEYSENGYVKVSMIKYVNMISTEFPESIGIPTANTVVYWMFQVMK